MAAVIAGLAGFFLIAYVVLKAGPDWFAETENLDAKGRADARQGVRTASLALLAGAIGVIGAIYTSRTFALNRAGQLTDRFTKAIEQLGHSEALDVRLGGIYALERIARDSKKDHPQVIEVLTAFVREHAPRRDAPTHPFAGGPEMERERMRKIADMPAEAASRKPATDVQAALTVLGRRTLTHEPDSWRTLDLSFTDLYGANLAGADLSGADLSETNLSKANLTEANLRRADLSQTDLIDANLSRANLRNASLRRANLCRASLTGAVLTDANISTAWYDRHTYWPYGEFDPEAAGASRVDGDENPEPQVPWSEPAAE